jgi:tetratricopeptide (TPR) repeat protein
MKKGILSLILSILQTHSIVSSHVYINHAMHAFKNKNKQECIANFNKALELNPESSQALFSLAQAYQYDGDLENASSIYERLLSLQPHHRSALYNYAHVLLALGFLDQGQHILETMYLYEPHARDLIQALLFLALRNSDWNNVKDLLPLHNEWKHIDQLWWFDKDIAGETIVLDLSLRSGGGIGDGINMLQYAFYLKQAHARVIIKTNEYLIPLLKCCPFVDEVISTTAVSTREIPLALQAFAVLKSQENIPQLQYPYLNPPADLVNEWKQKLNQNTAIKIGLCWNSSPFNYYFSGTTKTGPRSVDLTALAPLADIPGVNFYSLQKFNNTQPSLPSTFHVQQFPASIDTVHGRFMDTAAIIKNLDLVISVDTSIAHLAGALGVPVWTILIPECDWRWQRDKSSTHWYPNMKLFRKKNCNDLSTVIESMKQELTIMVKNNDTYTTP